MQTREIVYTDPYGRRFRVLIPAGAPDSEAEHGMILGPPILEDLGLPIEAEVRLHNQLEARGIIYRRDAERRPGEIVAALQAALKVDAQRVQALY